MAGANQARARGSAARGGAGAALGRRASVAGATIGSASAGLGRGDAGVAAVSDRGEVDWAARAGEDRRGGCGGGRPEAESLISRGVGWAPGGQRGVAM
jgi:hypothetical protein